MAATVKLVQRKADVRADGTAPVYVRVTVNRKPRFVQSGVRVKPAHWNPDKQAVRKSHELAAAFNARLQEAKAEARRAAIGAKTADAVRDALKGKAGDLTAYFESFIARLKRRDQYWERKKYQTTLNKLQASFGRDTIDFAELDRDALERFENYAREECGNNPNTTRKELVRLRRVIRQALKDGVIDAAADAFLSYDLPKGTKPDKRRLTREEMQAIEGVDLPEGLTLARDAFVFAFYGGGVRFSDVCRLKPESVQGGRLRYRMAKTDRPVDLPLPEPARRIAERYGEGPFIFPFLKESDTGDPVRVRKAISSKNALVNGALKEVAERAGIDRPETVSFHVSRHSFADFARQNSSDLYAVSKALGHSNLTTTETYLSSFDRDATDRLATELWGDEDEA